MLYTTNYEYGWFDLQVKLSLLLFPVIFATSEQQIFSRSRIRILMGAFLAGCMLGSMILIGHAWLVNVRLEVPDPFYYSNLAWYFHPSYLAMYYSFAVGIALAFLSVDFAKQPVYRTICMALIIVYFNALIFLLSSKAGLITLALTELLFIVLLVVKKAGPGRIVLVSVLFLTLFAGFSRLFPFAAMRMARADTAVSTFGNTPTDHYDGTMARMAIWKTSAGLIRQHFLFGVGTGDVKDTLTAAYLKQNMDLVVKKNLNAHNQYLQTFIALGVPGFLLLIGMLGIPGLWSLRRGDYLYFLFILIFSVSILVESMLESQAGVVFYAFFNAFLFSASCAGKDEYMQTLSFP
jgi:O-antigen ligase